MKVCVHPCFCRAAQSCVAKHAIQAKQRQRTKPLLQESVINRFPTFPEVYWVVFAVHFGNPGTELQPMLMRTMAKYFPRQRGL